MNAPTLVLLKKEHHAPNGERDARVFQLLSRLDGRGCIQEVVNDQPVGDVLMVDLVDLRYQLPSVEQGAFEREAAHGHNRVIDEMLRNDPVLDPNGDSHASALCMTNHLSDAYANRVIATLIKHGANINHQAFANDHGPYWTPFWNAVHDDKMEHAKRLLAHGASMELPIAHPEQTSDYSVLHLAASCGLWEMIAWLIDLPGRPQVKDEDIKHQLRSRDDRVDPVSYDVDWNGGVQVPLLHLTASGGTENMALARRFVDWLVESGEDWSELDHNGETAWQVARRLNSDMRPVFDEKLAHYHAAELQETTPRSAAPIRRSRM